MNWTISLDSNVTATYNPSGLINQMSEDWLWRFYLRELLSTYLTVLLGGKNFHVKNGLAVDESQTSAFPQ